MNTIEPEDVPCCPFCDNAIMGWEEAAVFHCGGAKCLVHSDCVPEETNEYSKDEA